MRDEHVVPNNTENGDQPNYRQLSQSDDSDPNITIMIMRRDWEMTHHRVMMV